MSDTTPLAARTVRSLSRMLACAFAIGLLAWLPIAGIAWAATHTAPPTLSRHTVSGEFEHAADDDRALERWLGSQGGLDAISIERATTSSGTVTVLFHFSAPAARIIEPPWSELGYGRPLSTSAGYSSTASFRVELGARYYFALLGACANLGFLVLGLRWWRRAGRAGSQDGLVDRGTARALAVAAVVGAAAAGVDRLWTEVPAIGGTMLGAFEYSVLWPTWARVATAVLLPLAMPLAQEPFFRGLGLATFAAADRRRALLWTAATFAVVQVLPTAWPPALVAGVAFGWLRQWSGSLRAAIVASVVFHALVFTLPLLTIGNPFDALLQAFGALPGTAAK